MKKLFTIAACVLFFVGSAHGQKVTEGSLTFLKDVKKLDFVFDYQKSEMSKKTDKDKKYVGDVFTRDLNKEVKDKGFDFEAGSFPSSEYVAKVITIKLKPGYMAGPMTQPSKVTVEVVITNRKTSKVMAKILIKNACGSHYDFANTYGAETNRIGSSYGEAGEQLGKAIYKIMKK